LFVGVGDEALPLPTFTILRDSTRLVRTSWPDPPLLCICHVVVHLNDGTGHVITRTAEVIVFPVRLLIGIVVAAIGLWLLTRRTFRARRLRRQARTEEIEARAYERVRRDLESSLRPAGPPDHEDRPEGRD
jgi:hypothetical protein